MNTISISQDNALKAYNAADQSQKSLLENLFGKENLQPKSIMDRVKTFEDALEIVGCEENEKILLTTTDKIKRSLQHKHLQNYASSVKL